jgi:hypothetical protein
MLEVARAAGKDVTVDALAHYESEFASLGMSNEAPGPNVLRHVFVLLLGLGMRESSGRHCEGRDMSADNVTAETAETGLFQVSYNSRSASPHLQALIADYQGREDFRAIFSDGVKCGAASWEDCGQGPGRDFQALAKRCPAFAVEYAAVLLRNRRRHWGPINRKEAELRPEADQLFRDVEAFLVAEGIDPV